MSILSFFQKKNTPKTVQIIEQPNAEDRKKADLEFELNQFIGKLVINVPNEIENVTVGIGKEIIYITKSQQPVLVFYDIVRKVEMMSLGINIAYTKQKFEGLNKLDGNERIALFYNRHSENPTDKSSTQSEPLVDSKLWAGMVEQEIANWRKK